MHYDQLIHHLLFARPVTRRDLRNVSQHQMETLIRRFPYSMANLIKNKNTTYWFEEKLIRSRHVEDCADCGKLLANDRPSEKVQRKFQMIDFICEECHKTMQKNKAEAKQKKKRQCYEDFFGIPGGTGKGIKIVPRMIH